MIQILIADDSETFRSTLLADLQGEGYQVEEARDGLEAIEKISSGKKFDLIVLDVNMPGATGIEVLEQTKSKNLLEKSLVFMLTTDASVELKTKGKALGVRAWITKPYKKDILLQAIKKVFSL